MAGATGALFVGISDRTKLRVAFLIPGPPKGKGRHRSTALMRNGKPVIGQGGRPVILNHSNPATVEYENLVRLAASEAMAGRAPTAQPVAVRIRAFYGVPKSWSKKRQALALHGLILPTVKPDLDNVEKTVMDGLNGIVVRDDVLACEVTKRKRYSDTPRVEVEVVELDGEPA